jgi:predicted dehydrogenase
LPGGVLGETGPHGVYLSLAFLKNIYKVEVSAKKLFSEYPWSRFEDFRVNLSAENGLGSVTFVYGSNQWAADIDVIGTEGILKIDLQTQSLIRYNRSHLSISSLGFHTSGVILQTLRALISGSLGYILRRRQDSHRIGIYKFIQSISENKALPLTPQQTRETVRIMEIIIERLKCAE